MKLIHITWFVLLSIFSVSQNRIFASETVRHYSGELSPNDYLMRSFEPKSDDVFDNFKVVDLTADLGVGSDCGRVDFKSTLRSSLQNILDTKYFGNLGQDIIASSPMLLACYFSPTWCAILKHSQVNANMLSQLRLNQCSIIDKYTDQRSEDFFQERQACVRKSIDQNGGDIEKAMESCRGNVFGTELPNWAGTKNGDHTPSNKLIESSAQWAGLNQGDAKSSIELVKSLVGDTVVSRGAVSVEYGQNNTAMTPRTFLKDLEVATEDRLCGNLLKKALESDNLDLRQVISEKDLKDLNPKGDKLLVDYETIRALTYLPPIQRKIACEKLASSMSLTVFSNEMNRSLDILTTLSQNPNLPETRKQEINHKREALRDSIELTMTLYEGRNKPLSNTLSQINAQASEVRGQVIQDKLSANQGALNSQGARSSLMDCADGLMCEGGPNVH